MLNRRRFLVSSGIGAGVFLHACKTTSGLQSDLEAEEAGPVSIRKRWTPGTQDDFKKKYADAVAWLKANDKQSFPAEDPRSFLSWDKIVNVHRVSCQHGNHLLLPWHRLYLQYFEQACRFALQDASFALPYWDWTQDRAIPDEFWDGALSEPRGMKKGSELTSDTVASDKMEDLLKNENWGNFHGSWPLLRIRKKGGWGGSLENGPHNFVHREVGGEMSDQFNSPVDPLFWLHHCNIDRLWAMWQMRNPGFVVPPKGDGPAIGDATPWEEKELLLETRRDKDTVRNPVLPESTWNRKVEPARKVQDVLSIRAMGFSYDTVPEPLPIRVVRKLVVKRRTLDSYEVTGTQSRRGSEVVGTFSFADADGTALIARLKSERAMYLTAVLGDLDLPSAEVKRKAEVRVFVSTEKDFGVRPEFFEATLKDKANYAGSAFFFGHSHDRKDHKVDFAFDLTALVKGFAEKGGVKELTVVAVAANNADAKSPFLLFPEGSTGNLSLSFDGSR